ncbi:RING finger protein 141-like [Centruroides vittatus]|uniref:RING finger protein 141-like n=1 Tax=Centruroides vittatus TaxID=120091 RepID=UPI00350F5C33
MGQNPSSQFDLNELKDDVCQGTQTLKDMFGTASSLLAVTSYDEFLEKVKELNCICQTLSRKISERSNNSKSLLLFAVKKGSDESVFWKGTVRIGCVLIDTQTGNIKSHRVINLKQFLKVHKALIAYVGIRSSGDIETAQIAEAAIAEEKIESTISVLSPSIILEGINAELSDPTECCICMERDFEITLPCAHSYCLVCIEQWNVSNKTCPICREKLENTGDSWVLSEIPDSEIVSAELLQTLMGMIEKIT